MKKALSLLILFLFLLSGCAGNGAQGSSQPDYDATKKMVVDILKTDEGKQAIQEIMKDDKIKESLIMDQQTVQESITKTLTSKEAKDFWKKQFEDPKFSEAFANSIKKEQEQLMKDLMKDPEYQRKIMDILQNPEMQQQYLKLLSTPDYREEMQKILTETIENPLFKVKMQEMLIKGAEELQKGEDKSKDSSDEGQDSSEEDGGGSKGSDT
ncbi:spore germination lipoprotein GerD [Bacillus solimangrovi]|uniref:Spore gernimation protein GerD n=1 Tax=Bacillus solimangrovi TaxID=1305675 RepID=A0A1E5LGM2_9BACI|nr:spore germination lipoprotein GerD [Bacillus solimangrovi]OEH93227.1 spore gernimation protein GerD [Bacillus solimangrovi]